MGCDIHGWIEWKPTDPAYGGRWVGVRPLTGNADDRNYERFAALAGVRGDGPEALGAPEDVSDTCRMEIERWDGDGHSHSYLPLPAALMIWKGTEHLLDGKIYRHHEESDGRYDARCRQFTESPEYYYFGVVNEPPRLAEMRVVFWFDN